MALGPLCVSLQISALPLAFFFVPARRDRELLVYRIFANFS